MAEASASGSADGAQNANGASGGTIRCAAMSVSATGRPAQGYSTSFSGLESSHSHLRGSGTRPRSAPSSTSRTRLSGPIAPGAAGAPHGDGPGVQPRKAGHLVPKAFGDGGDGLGSPGEQPQRRREPPALDPSPHAARLHRRGPQVEDDGRSLPAGPPPAVPPPQDGRQEGEVGDDDVGARAPRPELAE